MFQWISELTGNRKGAPMPWRAVFGLMAFYLVCSIVFSVVLSKLMSPIGDAVIATVAGQEAGQRTIARSADGVMSRN